MHLLPADQSHRRIIDGDRVCQAIAAVGDHAAVQALARRYALLADPGRLALLTAIAAVPDISVSDLAIAARMNDTATSQALRLLRVAGVVSARKDSRVMRYTLTDDALRPLLPQPSDQPGRPRPGPREGLTRGHTPS
jgi:DNA-binding transcriptional ArsR family regulator